MRARPCLAVRRVRQGAGLEDRFLEKGGACGAPSPAPDPGPLRYRALWPNEGPGRYLNGKPLINDKRSKTKMTTVQIDPPTIPSDSAVLCALKCYVRRYGAHAHGSPGDSVGSYSATDTPLEEAMAAAWCYWIAATPKGRNPSEALLRWHDRQILCDLVQEWQTRQTDRDLAHHELAPDPGPEAESLPSDPATLAALDAFVEHVRDGRGAPPRDRDSAWRFWINVTVREVGAWGPGVPDVAAQKVREWHSTYDPEGYEALRRPPKTSTPRKRRPAK